MPIIGGSPTHLTRCSLVSLEYGAGTSGHQLDLTVDIIGGSSGALLVFETTDSIADSLGGSLIADTYASGYDSLGEVSWVVWPSTSNSELLNGNNARVDLLTPSGHYHIYLETETERNLLGYALQGSDPPPDGLAAYIVAQWDVSSIVTSGSDIDTLTDMQSGGYDLTTTGTARPTLDTSNGPGGGNCISFDGTNDRFQLNGLTLTQPHAIVITANFIESSGTFWDGYSSGIFHLAMSWNLNMYSGGGGSLSNGTQSYGIGWVTWAFLFSGSSSYIRKNAGIEATGSGSSPGSSNGAGISFGGAYDGASYLQMRVARVTLVDATTSGDVITVADEHAVAFGTYTP